jgi:uncharacterized protein YecE (DUF72 family)
MAGGLRIGTSGWHYASWRGPFYPGALKPADFLAFYGTRFSSAEINNSSYRLPGEEAVAAWREGTPDGFLFAWKASRFITHMKKLRGVEESLDLVFGRMAGLRDKLGPVLFQLPPMLRADRDRLGGFLAILPRGHRVAVEFRHPSWYEPPILDLLREHDAALCLSDHAAAPAPWAATASFVYIRGHGADGRYAGNYTDETLEARAQRIAGWRAGGRDVHCDFDNDIKSAAPLDARRLMQRTGADAASLT